MCEIVRFWLSILRGLPAHCHEGGRGEREIPNSQVSDHEKVVDESLWEHICHEVGMERYPAVMF